MIVTNDQKTELIKTASKQFQAGQYKQAIDTCSEILEQQRDHQGALMISGLAALTMGAANTTELHLSEALRLLAEDANMVPTVTLSDEERETGSPKRQTANDATSLFRHFGYLIVENLFEKTYIEGMLDYFRNEYPQFFKPAKGSAGIEVSDGRSLIKTPIDGAFNDPAFYMPELLYPILTQLLGDRFIMLTLGTVVSRPGAQEQRIHSDHSPLFDAQELNRQVPPFAVTVATPLIDMNGVTGTTRMYDKTHLRIGFLSEAEKQCYIEPEISVGSVLLFDYRLQHCSFQMRSMHKYRQGIASCLSGLVMERKQTTPHEVLQHTCFTIPAAIDCRSV